MKQHHIKNIYCVGRNYRLHAAELGNEVPDKPMIFSKPTHSLILMNGQHIELPGDQGEIHYEAELVVHISRKYEPGLSVNDLIDQVALGIDLTLRDVQSELKRKGSPWLAAKGFKHSAPITNFFPFPGMKAIEELDFTLLKNSQEVQRGNCQDMIFNLQHIVDHCAYHFGLGAGDIIYTGTPAGVGPATDGDHFILNWGDEAVGDCIIKIKDC